MAKFSNTPTPVRGPIATIDPAYTHEGGEGWTRDAKSELFLLGISNLVGEDTFYETATDRDIRYQMLIAAATQEDPEWVGRFLPWLRTDALLRTAPLVGAAHAAAAGYPEPRRLIDAVLQRPDEPAELLAFWHQSYGRRLPAGVKRGIADAATRLYTEKAAIKYDGRKGWRFADVIDLTHPRPHTAGQSALFKWLLDTRHGHIDSDLTLLPVIAEKVRLEAVPVEERRALLGNLPEWVTWEWLSGWLPGGMDAAAWEAVIPNMGVLALVRNLRNFDEAGISDQAAATVVSRLTDPDAVARSRALPLRFLTAWLTHQSMRWAVALERAVQLTLTNVPQLPGRSLVMVDMSYSMSSKISQRSVVTHEQVASVFGAALAETSTVDLVAFSDTGAVIHPRGSVLRVAETLRGSIDHKGTRTAEAVLAAYQGQDRVIVITDEQAHHGPSLAGIPVPIYTFNLVGYSTGWQAERADRLTFGGGLTDGAFRLLALLDSGRSGSWPF